MEMVGYTDSGRADSGLVWHRGHCDLRVVVRMAMFPDLSLKALIRCWNARDWAGTIPFAKLDYARATLLAAYKVGV